ncbi:hypothetical protein [Allonocardiopsis opalescens]|uniref:Uncharacterized protein n=1 Tax=Allonocardiopsis opalescens TaxID=1144618 RepID=A0A2T0Q3Q4_9ACTN|nr:hypothetical protein [Allonocardiopsis opalescens]PRX98436.1 hypothetical protein CLV72_10412 [Allonocardiopsis opalescens]
MLTALVVRGLATGPFAVALRPLTALGPGDGTPWALALLRRAALTRPGRPVPLPGRTGHGRARAAEVLDGLAVDIELEHAHGRSRTRLRADGPDATEVRVVPGSDAPPAALAERGWSFVRVADGRIGTSAAPDERTKTCAQVLADHERAPVRPVLRFPPPRDDRPGRLRAQAELWAGYVARPDPGRQPALPGMPAAPPPAARFRGPGLNRRVLLPASLDRGFRQALPVTVAGLLVAPGGLLVVGPDADGSAGPEGPAALRLGAFLARVGAARVQVVLATAEPHLVAGLRIPPPR